VHFSTDYVFDGSAGRPTRRRTYRIRWGAYAVSKLAGELYAQAYLDAPLIIRTSGVFGPGGLKTARGNFIELMLRLASNTIPIRCRRGPFRVADLRPGLAGRTLDLVERNCQGVFHGRGRNADLVVRFREADL
jgi:dTDP-4-dehydrorhamnose reductase